MSGFSGGAAAAGLLCPACRIDLVMSERQGIEIDYCPKCRGVWLDRGELDKIIEKNRAYEARAAAPQQTYAPAGYPPQAHPQAAPGWGQAKRKERRESFLERLFD